MNETTEIMKALESLLKIHFEALNALHEIETENFALKARLKELQEVHF